MLENFPAYLLSQTEKFDSTFEELCEYKLKKRPVYSASVIQFALLLRYTSIQSYRILQKDFPLPSTPLLKKICSGAVDAVKCAQTLKNEGKICEDVWLLFNEMYLQKCEEYFGWLVEKWNIEMSWCFNPNLPGKWGARGGGAAGGGGIQIDPPPPSVVIQKMYILKRGSNPGFLWLLILS